MQVAVALCAGLAPMSTAERRLTAEGRFVTLNPRICVLRQKELDTVMNLYEHFCELCTSEKPYSDLADRLRRVRESAERIWQHQRLEWFPDHTISHSDRIVRYLGDILGHLQQTNQQLNSHQLYVLLASSYLHDIGMQDFRIEGQTIDRLTAEDYEEVRRRHPGRSSELILSQRMAPDQEQIKIDLDPNPEYTVPIALVSKAHGSAYFESTVNELRCGAYSPGNQELRGDLLAALLLIADELDLHETRARFPPGIDMSPLAALHNHIHHCITQVKVTAGDVSTQRRVHIKFQYPVDSEGYKSDIRWWVVNKLCRQMRRTQSMVQSSTSGQLSWDQQIHLQEFVDSSGSRRELPDPAQVRLRYARSEAEIIGRRELLDTFKHAICESQSQGSVVEILDTDNSDWSHLVKWLTSLVGLHNARFIRVSLELKVGHGSQDILEMCRKQLEISGLSCSRYEKVKATVRERQHNKLDVLTAALGADLEDNAKRECIVLLLEHIDQAESGVGKWLGESFLPELKRKSGHLVTIVTYKDPQRSPSLGFRFTLDPFSREVLAGHLTERLGYPEQEASMKAEEMHALSNGTPLNVLTYLSSEGRKQFISTKA